jgi:hypothetical protein
MSAAWARRAAVKEVRDEELLPPNEKPCVHRRQMNVSEDKRRPPLPLPDDVGSCLGRRGRARGGSTSVLLLMLPPPGGVAVAASVVPSMTRSESANWSGSPKGNAADE